MDRRHFLAFGGVILPVASAFAADRKLGLVLPTPNDALFSGNPSRFYMYTDRNFEGKSSRPYTGGKYGYVRNGKRVGKGIIYTKFHEGVDIAPARRAPNGEPLDRVNSIAAGRVVHASANSSKSSYGKYAVVEHDWGSGSFYSLYAHLKSVAAKPGQWVSAGTNLGVLGYTGRGINLRRAHVHLELNLLLNAGFNEWHSGHYRDANHHGAFNGLNMAGIDIAGLFLRHRENNGISLPAFIGGMSPYYKVTTARGAQFDLTERYPWLKKGSQRGAGMVITFSRSGVPLAVSGTKDAPKYPYVSWVRSSRVSHSWNTRSRLTGSGSKAGLSSGGSRYVQLVAGTF